MKNKFILSFLAFLAVVSFAGYTFCQQTDIYTSLTGEYSFKIPAGWSVTNDSGQKVLLSNARGSATIEVDLQKDYFKDQQAKDKLIAENKSNGIAPVIFKGYPSLIEISQSEHLIDRRGDFPTDNPNDDDLWSKKCNIIKENDLFSFIFQAKERVYDKYSQDFDKFQENFEFLKR